MKKETYLASTGISQSRQLNTSGSIQILQAFYLEAKKELEKNDCTIVNLNSDECMCNITFVTDGFNLSLIITEDVKKGGRR